MEEKKLSPAEVKVILLSLSTLIDDMDTAVLPDGKRWNEDARKAMQEMAGFAQSAKKKLEAATMGGAEMKVDPYISGDEKQFLESIEREEIDIPNDKGTPKLKRLIAEIGDILIAENVAGIVALHTPGVAEHMLFLTPAYSCVKLTSEGYRFLATEKEHGKEGKAKMLADTANMLHQLGMAAAEPTMIVVDMEKQLDDALKAKGLGTFNFKPIEKDKGQDSADPLESDEYQFKAVSRVTLKPGPEGKNSNLRRTDIYLEVFGPIDPDVYTRRGIPTKEGITPLTIALAHGLVSNIHLAHSKGWWDSAEHMRYIMGLLERGFVEVVYPTEGIY